METGTIALFLVGAFMLIIGMAFFQLGAETAMTPLGEGVGSSIMKTRKLPVLIGVCFLMGIIITLAEPDLQVLANQVPSIPNNTLIFTVALGVGVFLVIAVLRILFRISLPVLLCIFYIALFFLSFAAPADFIAVAFDSGGVTTGPMTVPFIMAIGVGLSATRNDKNGSSDSSQSGRHCWYWHLQPARDHRCLEPHDGRAAVRRRGVAVCPRPRAV